MQLLTLRFKNLNSLYGEWEIDFTALSQNGLFSITGPTGSGKTTILDAVSLALYGSTPRLGRFTSGKNEIMSKNTDISLSELTFQIGKRGYKASWRQKRHKNRELSTPKCALFNMDGSLSELNVEQITGVNSTDFERLVLLAQGKWTTFLYARENEKAALLENLTDAEIYRRISQKVYERSESEENILRGLQTKLSDLKSRLLTAETKSKLEQRLAESKKEADALKRELTVINDRLTLARESERLKSEAELLDRQLETLCKDEEIFNPYRTKVAAAKRAARLIPFQQNADNCRQMLLKDEADRLALFQALSDAQNESGVLKIQLKTAEDSLNAAVHELSSAEADINEARRLDLLTAQYERELDRIGREAERLDNGVKAAFKDITAIDAKIVEINSSFEKLLSELRERHILADTELLRLTGGETAAALTAKRAEYLVKAELTDHRERLEDNKPCPLCGSVEHPYKTFSSQFIKELSILEAAIDKAKVVEKEKLELQRLDSELQNQHERELITLTERGKALTASVEKDAAELSIKEGEYKIIKAESDAVKARRAELLEGRSPDVESTRLKMAREDAEKLLQVVQKRRAELDAELTRLKTQSETLLQKISEDKLAAEHSIAILMENLKKEGFADLDEFKSAVLVESEITRLTILERELADRRNSVDIRKGDLNKRMEELEKLESIIPPSIELEHEREAALSKLAAAAGAAGECGHILKENEQFCAAASVAVEQTELFENKIKPWRTLNALIGSARGDKFAKAVQTLIFGDLLDKANVELLKISNRYRLSRTDNLEIQVIDNEQRQAVRSAKNLSGGESFIISLALALGLSSLSTRKVSPPALFLDEGFGSLDTEHAEQALNALAGLKSRKLIGLISHLDIIKQKVEYQIKVEPVGEGKSILMGKGVRRIE
ncbi:MAG: AAA family ATPase [Deferribacteraceae bacterium]|jgi:exonuclease SbcC|nr:AAA family ATPase [Deferribacteraceae bacterium]